ncbi:MAG: hypothetical protein IPM25_18615 [Chloracidobacterium sp.]|nr:hypothetical protein [Chloracidobacterium sp.]
MSASLLERTIEIFDGGMPLDADSAEGVLDALIEATDEELIARVLTAWHRKGIESEEIFQLARILRERMIRVRAEHDIFFDIVGTGGSKVKTFNVSTASAFVAAGAGLPVAKHGNKAATSNSGSADVLSELGVDPAPSPEAAEKNLNKIGICFMFAPNHHRLSPTLGKVRRGLGFPTIFNCVGPIVQSGVGSAPGHWCLGAGNGRQDGKRSGPIGDRAIMDRACQERPRRIGDCWKDLCHRS